MGVCWRLGGVCQIHSAWYWAFTREVKENSPFTVNVSECLFSTCM